MSKIEKKNITKCHKRLLLHLIDSKWPTLIADAIATLILYILKLIADARLLVLLRSPPPILIGLLYSIRVCQSFHFKTCDFIWCMYIESTNLLVFDG